MLVAAGASLTMRDANGLTPMMIAFQVEDNDLATYLESTLFLYLLLLLTLSLLPCYVNMTSHGFAFPIATDCLPKRIFVCSYLANQSTNQIF